MHTFKQLCDRLRAHTACRPIAYLAMWLAPFLLLTTAAVAQETVTYYHTDAVGSVRVTTDASGQPTFYDYLPFGEPFTPPPTPTPRGFAGKEKDADTNLDYFGARYYASGTGRFTTVDPAPGHLENPQTFNRYAYAGNNPLRFTDPTGLDFWLQCQEEGATCHDGYAGTYNDKKRFDRTVVTSASLQNPKSGNTAVVDANGLSITNSSGTYQGVFINNTPALDIAGTGRFEGFMFHIDHSELATGNLAAGYATFRGTRAEAVRALMGNGSWRYRLDSANLNPFHSSDAQHFRFGQGPSPHFAVSSTMWPSIEFHVDSAVGYRHAWCASGAGFLGGLGCR